MDNLQHLLHIISKLDNYNIQHLTERAHELMVIQDHGEIHKILKVLDDEDCESVRNSVKTVDAIEMIRGLVEQRTGNKPGLRHTKMAVDNIRES